MSGRDQVVEDCGKTLEDWSSGKDHLITLLMRPYDDDEDDDDADRKKRSVLSTIQDDEHVTLNKVEGGQ